MRIQSLAALAFTLSCATLASAQAGTAGQATGFFRPSPDPSLTAPRPTEAAPPARPIEAAPPARPTEALTAEDKVQAAQENVAADRAPDPVKVMQWSERQMDRARQEAEQAKPQGPAPVNGSFTGLTGERNR